MRAGASRRLLIPGLVAGYLALAPAPTASAAPHMVIVAGLGGEPDYAAAFAEQAAAAARAGEPVAASVTLLHGESATRASIREALAGRTVSGTAEPVVLVLIGHGSYDDEHYRFNVLGPDPTAEDLAAWLSPLPAERQLVVLATSASGAAVDVLEQEGRAVIAATRDGRERNAVVFGRFWVAALAEAQADTDKDGRIDADEAFRFAEQAVAAHYEGAQRIATEHPRAEGLTVGFTLAALAERPGALTDVGPATFAGRRAELLDEIDALRAAKDRYAEEDYFSALQELLLELSAAERGSAMRRPVEPRSRPDGIELRPSRGTAPPSSALGDP